jgi:hypothetical protein
LIPRFENPRGELPLPKESYLSYVVEETDVEEDSLGGRGTGSKSGAV